MSKIDHQALREVAERAIPAMERLLMLPADDDLLSEQELKDYGVDIDALNAFKFLTGPETVLALLDERERNQQYIKLRDQENEDIALTVVKLRVELEATENNLIDSECHVAELEEALRDKQALLEASEKRIAEQSSIVTAAEKLVRCKGRYHSEQNYRALAALFGVTVPDLPPLQADD
ncbi:TPA: ead/Ea22-like family protein [Escherichia coli]|nr:ead/Ea22-like family protein [Escherichia coli]